ncbi:MAG: hypothetical protein DCC67_04530 [Planctomycetota bacterium]|nr:MAG: hypothetical protein DCC67_04530 [Planctomycetota bacterium]
MKPAARAPSRIVSLDQFRGYTVAGMFLVNFTGSYAAAPTLFKHHNTFCSYADTIMPQFFFAVGLAMRLTFERRIEREGATRAYARMVRRILGLAVIAALVYLAPQAVKLWALAAEHGRDAALAVAVRDWFQTLLHIAVTSLWILPVIRTSAATRTAYAAASALLLLVLSHWFYFDWVQTGGIDGGVLGFLAWTTPTIAGTIACDWIAAADGPRLGRLFSAGAALMLAGWLLSCGTTLYDIPPGAADPLPEQDWAADPVVPTASRLRTHSLGWAEPPFVPPPPPERREENFWMMSQRAATLSYHVFAAGLSLAVYGLFYLACDVAGWQLGLFRTLGVNALAGYVLHDLIGRAMDPLLDRDAPPGLLAGYFLAYFALVYAVLRVMEWRRIYLRI